MVGSVLFKVELWSVTLPVSLLLGGSRQLCGSDSLTNTWHLIPRPLTFLLLHSHALSLPDILSSFQSSVSWSQICQNQELVIVSTWVRHFCPVIHSFFLFLLSFYFKEMNINSDRCFEGYGQCGIKTTKYQNTDASPNLSCRIIVSVAELMETPVKMCCSSSFLDCFLVVLL